MRRRGIDALAFALLAMAAASQTACSAACDRTANETPVEYTGGRTDRQRGFYESTTENGPFLDFPPGRTYRFFHHLGGVPEQKSSELAFDRFPHSGNHPSGSVEAAGNQVTWEVITDQYADVRNDTCSDVFLRITLSEPSLPDAAAPDGG
jgi:hypothetical protein